MEIDDATKIVQTNDHGNKIKTAATPVQNPHEAIPRQDLPEAVRLSCYRAFVLLLLHAAIPHNIYHITPTCRSFMPVRAFVWACASPGWLLPLAAKLTSHKIACDLWQTQTSFNGHTL